MEENVIIRYQSELGSVQQDLERTNKLLEELLNTSEETAKTLEKDLPDGSKKASRELSRLGGSLSSILDELEAAISQIPIFGKSIASLSKGFRSAIAGIGATTKATKILKVALFSLGIPALIIGIASLVTYLTQFQEGMDLVTRATKIAQQVFQRTIRSVGAFGDAFKKLFAGDFSGALEATTKGFQDVANAIQEGVKSGNELADVLERLRDVERDTGRTVAKLEEQLETNKRAAEDVTKSLQERIRLYEAAQAASEAIAAAETNQAQLQLQAIRKENEGLEDQDKFKDLIAEKEAELSNIRRDNEARLTELQNARNAAVQEEIRLRQEAAQAQLELFRQIRAEVAEIEGTQGLNDIIEQVEKLQGEIAKIAEVGGDSAQFLPTLESEVLRLQQRIQEIRNRVQEAGLLETRRIGDDELQAFQDVNAAKIDDERETLEVLDSLRNRFKVSEEDRMKSLKNAADQLTGEISNILGSLSEVYSERLAENQRLAGDTQRRLDELLDDEEAVSGRQVRIERERLQALEAEQRKYIQRQRALAEVQKAIAQSVATANAIQAITEAYKSGNPLRGILVGATIASAIAGAIASISSSFQGFRTGTEYVHGEGTGTSDSIFAKLSKGERVLTARQNDALGGSQLSNTDLVNYAIAGMNMPKAMIPRHPSYQKKEAVQFAEMGGWMQRIHKAIQGQEISFNVDEKGIYAAVKSVEKRQVIRQKMRR